MKVFSPAIAFYEGESEKQPRFVFRVSWDLADTDYTYFTGSTDAQTPSGADVIASTILKDGISGQTQKINPDIATSTIGSITVKLLDVNQAITSKMGAKLAAGNGLRGRVCRVYVGYYGMPFTDYDLRVTYVVDSVTYLDGVYTLKLSDIQRASRKKIFSPKETNLNQSVLSTDMLIPVTTSDLTLFPVFEHGSEYTVRPGETVSYAKLEKEVFCYSGMVNDGTLGPSFVVIERGALNTKAVDHTVKTGTETSRRQKITEHIYIEGAAPKVIYALLTGKVEGQVGDMPAHWHLGISTSFAKLTDFQTLGDDYWNVTNNSGRFVRIENPGTQDGKRYIEKELLLWCGAFMPVYADGSIGIKRLRQTLSDSSYNVYLDASNIKSYSTLNHSMQAVINSIETNWNWVDSKKEFTKTSVLVDAVSIAIHGESDVKKFALKAVHTGLHTDEDLLTYFDTLRDRYSGPPLLMSVECMPSMSMLEVGDTVHVALDQVRDFISTGTLSRVFEVQQVSTNWMTGNLRLSLFGSSQKAGEISRTTLSTVLNDSYYISAGTELSTVLTIVSGVVTTSGTLTGHATDIDNTAAIYYYNGDLTIDVGVIVSITENVQLRVKGSLQVNGEINGVGAGATGGAATTLFTNGLTTQTFKSGPPSYVAAVDIDFDPGEQGYFGTTVGSNGLFTSAVVALPPPAYSAISVNGTLENQQSAANSAVPFYKINNKTALDSLSGYPADLRGNSGIGGVPYIHDGYVILGFEAQHTLDILANGGAGGNGGAGFLAVVRGMAFGGSGKINLSGGDSSVGTSYTQTTGDKFWGSSGAPGAPGTFILLIDGNATNPDVDSTNFVANYGDAPVPAGATEVGVQEIESISPIAKLSNWTYGDAVQNKAPYAAAENISASASAHRIIYIPPDETVQEEVDQPPANITDLAASNVDDLIKLKWSFTESSNVDYYEVRVGGANWAASTFVANVKTTYYETRDLPAGVQTVRIKARNLDGQYSVAEDNVIIYVPKVTLVFSHSQRVESPNASAVRFSEGIAYNKDVGDGLLFLGDPDQSDSGANAGATHIYEEVNGKFVYVQQVKPAALATKWNFGWSCAIEKTGGKLAVGAPGYDTSVTAKLIIFKQDFTTGNYAEHETLVGSSIVTGPTYSASLGYELCVSEDGQHLVASAPFHWNGTTEVGALVYWEWDGSNYIEKQTIIPDSTVTGNGYFFDMTKDGTRFVTNIRGSVKILQIYNRVGTVWSKGQAIAYTPTYATVKISGDGKVIVAGYYWQDVGAYTRAGRAYIYTLDDDGNYTLKQTIDAPILKSNGEFARNIGVNYTGSRIVFGASGFDGVNDTSILKVGRGFIYDRSTENVNQWVVRSEIIQHRIINPTDYLGSGRVVFTGNKFSGYSFVMGAERAKSKSAGANVGALFSFKADANYE